MQRVHVSSAHRFRCVAIGRTLNPVNVSKPQDRKKKKMLHSPQLARSHNCTTPRLRHAKKKRAARRTARSVPAISQSPHAAARSDVAVVNASRGSSSASSPTPRAASPPAWYLRGAGPSREVWRVLLRRGVQWQQAARGARRCPRSARVAGEGSQVRRPAPMSSWRTRRTAR